MCITEMEQHVVMAKVLAIALALQFQRFIEADSEDVNNEVPTEYEALVNGYTNMDRVFQEATYNMKKNEIIEKINLWSVRTL